ncbi:tRNA pseudouridine(38-40) synthase TruA [Porphyromonas pogonae]|uniref:tRNA pseudouridine(38-40) synthase TruA n=1 Tax=Porphyromonas pogonae TaxID=867595 RepID=UPI002E78CA4F|nr:tRNA pseudouridine(38-40) synthase TruA [Porphyromonas pogonae]
MRYFIYLSYNGTNYSGWQTQPNAVTVQQTIEEALCTILRKPTPILGAGRTDAGVHAREMIAHVELDMDQSEADALALKLDRLLPPDISIRSMVHVKADAHARFDAVSRTYRYYITMRKDPFAHGLMLRMHRTLDIDEMNEAASHLMRYTDFTSFSKLHTDVKTNNCKITHALWTVGQDSDHYVFTITADRFLRNMVRAIVGTLFQVGWGKMSVTDFCTVIERQDRCQAGSSAPGHALYLEEVKYPQEIFITE